MIDSSHWHAAIFRVLLGAIAKFIEYHDLRYSEFNMCRSAHEGHFNAGALSSPACLPAVRIEEEWGGIIQVRPYRDLERCTYENHKSYAWGQCLRSTSWQGRLTFAKPE
jgi:hypothetical protein